MGAKCCICAVKGTDVQEKMLKSTVQMARHTYMTKTKLFLFKLYLGIEKALSCGDLFRFNLWKHRERAVFAQSQLFFPSEYAYMDVFYFYAVADADLTDLCLPKA